MSIAFTEFKELLGNEFNLLDLIDKLSAFKSKLPVIINYVVNMLNELKHKHHVAHNEVLSNSIICKADKIYLYGIVITNKEVNGKQLPVITREVYKVNISDEIYKLIELIPDEVKTT